MSTWWDRATQEQRLSQLDGAIECGMTARQFLASIGESNPTLVRQRSVMKYANDHQRRFSGKSFNQVLIASVCQLRRHHNEEIAIPGAFSIFGGNESNDNLFNAHPND